MANRKDDIKKKLDYLGLNLNHLPRNVVEFEPLEFMVLKGYEEANHYKQYRYIPIRDIQILLSPTNRLDEIEKKYKKASPLRDYLDNKNERNITKHTTFLKMLKSMNIKQISEIEIEQAELSRKVPFKVKYKGNYLWQIYYAEETNKYFMLVPTEDSNYSTFFYLLKKQLETGRAGSVFVPIRNADYSSKYIKRRMFEEMENYIWEFAKEWPFIYEVYDKSNNLSIHIVGETEVYDGIKSPYRIKLSSKEETIKFFKLLKAMFILKTEASDFFDFKTSISRLGGIDFYFKDQLIEYKTISHFVNSQYKEIVERRRESSKLITKYRKMLEKLQKEASALDIEYLAKERQISTFLECKKTFFGKVKYYFKYSKKKQNKKKKENEIIEKQEEKVNKTKLEKRGRQYTKVVVKNNYTIDDLIKLCKEVQKIENTMKNLLMDINALKLKNKNMKLKIENAKSFIQEIDNHKKSIFEFWKYTNKDEVATLSKGEAVEVNVVKNVKKVFDYTQDLEQFGEKMDQIQRQLLTKDEMDSIFITTTTQLKVLNKVKRNRALPKDIELSLKQIKRELKQQLLLTNEEEFDVFGGRADTTIRELNNKRHRENPKDKFKILEVNKNSKQIGYKLTLERMLDNINRALSKVRLNEDIVAYKAISGGRYDHKDINIFNFNPIKELKRAFKSDNPRVTIYKMNFSKGTHAIGYTNSIYYDNLHKTLPVGMNEDTKVLVDTSKLDLQQIKKHTFKMIDFEDEKDDFSKIRMKTVTMIECGEKNEDENEEKDS